MALRFYVVPKAGTGTFNDPFRPKYFQELGIGYSAMDYGPENMMLVGANTTDAQHASLSGNSDVLAVPPLDTAVGGNPTLNQIKNRLEGLFVPAHWIQSTTLWREVVGRVGDGCLILQRMNGTGRRVFGPGVQLDSTLSQEVIDQFTEALTPLRVDTSTLTTGTLYRDALLALGDQLPPFWLAGQQF